MKGPQLRTLNILGFLQLLLVAGLNLVGMYAALFAELPDAARWAGAMGSHSVTTHMTLGLLILVFAVVLLLLALRAKSKAWSIPSALGLLGIVGGTLGGSWFVSADNDTATLLMAISATVAVVAYALGLLLANHETTVKLTAEAAAAAGTPAK